MKTNIRVHLDAAGRKCAMTFPEMKQIFIDNQRPSPHLIVVVTTATRANLDKTQASELTTSILSPKTGTVIVSGDSVDAALRHVGAAESDISIVFAPILQTNVISTYQTLGSVKHYCEQAGKTFEKREVPHSRSGTLYLMCQIAQ